MLWPAVHLRPEAWGLIFGIASIVRGDVGNVIERRLVDCPQPRERVSMHCVRVSQQVGQLKARSNAHNLAQPESGTDSGDREWGANPGFSHDQFWDVADGGIDSPVLAASHVPQEEGDWIRGRERPSHELARGEVVGGVV